MDAIGTPLPTAGQLLVGVSDLSMMNDIKKAIRMLKGVTTVKKTKEFDITKTKGYREAMDDVKNGRVYHAESVDDMFKQILGEEAFSKIRRSNV